eukprot:403345399
MINSNNPHSQQQFVVYSNTPYQSSSNTGILGYDHQFDKLRPGGQGGHVVVNNQELQQNSSSQQLPVPLFSDRANRDIYSNGKNAVFGQTLLGRSADQPYYHNHHQPHHQIDFNNNYYIPQPHILHSNYRHNQLTSCANRTFNLPQIHYKINQSEQKQNESKKQYSYYSDESVEKIIEGKSLKKRKVNFSQQHSLRMAQMFKNMSYQLKKLNQIIRERKARQIRMVFNAQHKLPTINKFIREVNKRGRTQTIQKNYKLLCQKQKCLRLIQEEDLHFSLDIKSEHRIFFGDYSKNTSKVLQNQVQVTMESWENEALGSSEKEVEVDKNQINNQNAGLIMRDAKQSTVNEQCQQFNNQTFEEIEERFHLNQQQEDCYQSAADFDQNQNLKSFEQIQINNNNQKGSTIQYFKTPPISINMKDSEQKLDNQLISQIHVEEDLEQ